LQRVSQHPFQRGGVQGGARYLLEAICREREVVIEKDERGPLPESTILPEYFCLAHVPVEDGYAGFLSRAMASQIAHGVENSKSIPCPLNCAPKRA
jgi:hypothetical protein